ncbi:uncharacterized protein LOC111580775 isoform X4 [Amphiprion ocellaris]|uniref:uncharacterized protein LOC111580775 isoform X4 n=1 Tax=Amphiprion ocellaris TaxID=80972 RepID=UPI0024111D09|nr:uncharacterized protein LOC111580775 isoform X4 [Amphiprion ocellaris]
MTGGSIKWSVVQMKACMSTASRGGTFSPNAFKRAQGSCCFHQHQGPVEAHSFPPDTLSLWACKGFCCPLQQRPCSGRVRPKVTLQSRGGGDGRLTVQCSLRSRLESGAKPAARSRTGTGPEMKPQGLAAAVSHCLDPASETAKSATTPCENKRQAGDGQPGATKVSELHLYLPSLICEDDKQDGEAEEMRTLVVETRV